MKDKFSYYNQKVLKNMACIEIKTKKMFHEVYPDLEKRFWEVTDKKNLQGIKSVCFKLDKIIDEINNN